MKEQTIFKRYEVKYRITREQKERLLKVMADHMRPDKHGESTILSLYFDTPDHLLIRRSMEHPEYKEKIRIRSYGVPAAGREVFLELKKKYQKVVYKRRLTVTEEAAWKALCRGERLQTPDYQSLQTAREIAFACSRYPGLAPRMMICYDREAWYDKWDHDLRITFDRNVRWRDRDLALSLGDHGTPVLAEDEILMEIKTGSAIPLWLTEFLSLEGIYKTSFSKYAHAYEAMLGRDKVPERVRGMLLARTPQETEERREWNYGYDFSRAV